MCDLKDSTGRQVRGAHRHYLCLQTRRLACSGSTFLGVFSTFPHPFLVLFSGVCIINASLLFCFFPSSVTQEEMLWLLNS